AARDRGHAGPPRAPRRRGGPAPRAARRPRGARRRRPAAPGRRGPRGARRRGRPGRLRGAGERGGSGRSLARALRAAVRRLTAPRTLVAVAAAAYAAWFSLLSVWRHDAFETGRFDLGNMVQVVWSTAHGHPLRMTNTQGEQVSRLAAHVDPILALFAPLWWIWPSPDMLLVLQAIAVAAGAF